MLKKTETNDVISALLDFCPRLAGAMAGDFHPVGTVGTMDDGKKEAGV